MLILILQNENFSFQKFNSTFIRHLNRCNLVNKIAYKPSLIRKKEHHTRRCWIISDTFYPAGPINGVNQCYQAGMCINIPIKPHAHTSKDTGDQKWHSKKSIQLFSFVSVCSKFEPQMHKKKSNDYKVVFLLHVRSLKNLDLPDWKCVFNIEGKWCTGGW